MDMALNNLQRLMCHKTKLNKTKLFHPCVYITDIYYSVTYEILALT